MIVASSDIVEVINFKDDVNNKVGDEEKGEEGKLADNNRFIVVLGVEKFLGSEILYFLLILLLLIILLLDILFGIIFGRSLG